MRFGKKNDSAPAVESGVLAPESAMGDSPRSAQPVSRRTRRARRVLIAIIIILLLALCGITYLLGQLAVPRAGVASKAEAGGITWVRSIYGWGPAADQQFVTPRELEIAKNGDILVTDSKQRSAFRFSPEGRLVELVGTVQDTFTGYGPIAEGPEGRIFIGEPERDRVYVWAPSGETLGIFTVPRPLDIATHEDRLLVGSIPGFALVDAMTGELQSIFGNRGKGDAEFDTVNGVAYDRDGNIYIADLYNNRLSKYDPEGVRLWMVNTGAAGNEIDVTGIDAMNESRITDIPAALQLPSDLCIDSAGRVVVVDAFDFSITLFDGETGELIAKYGEMGGADGQFRYPSSIAYDPQRDWFVVADTGNSRVQIVRIDGSGGGGDILAAARRTIAGPLRACLIPLILLVILVIAWSIQRVRNRRSRSVAATVDRAPAVDRTP